MAALLAAELIAAVTLAAPSHRAVPGIPNPPSAAPPYGGERRFVDPIDLGGPAGQALLDRVGANMADAVTAVEAFWGADWPQRITVTATGTDAQFAALANGAVGDGPARWSDVAAVAVADRVDTEHRVVTGQQLVFAPGAATMSTPALRIVLAHELFHYAARVDTAADAPRWLVEGVADFVARPGPVPPGLAAVLPTDGDLDSPGPARVQAYDRAWAFARFVADRFGTGKLRELYLTACGPGHLAPAVAVRRVLDADLPEVLAGWRHWLPSAG